MEVEKNQKKVLKFEDLDGLFYRGVLETAEPGTSGKFKNQDTGDVTEYDGGIKLNFSTIVNQEKIIAGNKIITQFKQNFVIKDECSDDEIIEKLKYWQSKQNKTLTIQLSATKTTSAKLIREL